MLPKLLPQLLPLLLPWLHAGEPHLRPSAIDIARDELEGDSGMTDDDDGDEATGTLIERARSALPSPCERSPLPIPMRSANCGASIITSQLPNLVSGCASRWVV